MDDALRLDSLEEAEKFYNVLILVLMDDALRLTIISDLQNSLCLNPCFNG